MPKVSVIIPVYNTEKYLRKCLDSVCGQTLSDIEIICINDGSTDNSLTILEEYAQRDARVRVINLESNEGASYARNQGIKTAQGKYIGFVDSDDFPESNFYKLLYTAAIEKNAEVAKGHYRYTQTQYIEKLYNEKIKEDKTNFVCEYCSCIISTFFLHERNIYFDETLIDMEDPVFAFTIALQYKTIVLVNNAIINIYQHDESSTAGIPSRSRIESKLRGLEKIVELANKSSIITQESYGYVLALWIIVTFNNSISNRDVLTRTFTCNKILNLLSKIKNKDEFLAVCKHLSPELTKYFLAPDLNSFFYYTEDAEIEKLRDKYDRLQRKCDNLQHKYDELQEKNVILTSRNKKLQIEHIRNIRSKSEK